MDCSKVFIVGRMSRDPKIFGEGDKARALFGVATGRGRGDNRKTTFVDCIAWGRRSDLVAMLSKGDGVVVEGDLEMDQWEKDGQKHQRIQINVNTITPTTGFPDSNGGSRQSQSSNSSDDDVAVDIPF